MHTNDILTCLRLLQNDVNVVSYSVHGTAQFKMHEVKARLSGLIEQLSPKGKPYEPIKFPQVRAYREPSNKICAIREDA